MCIVRRTSILFVILLGGCGLASPTTIPTSSTALGQGQPPHAIWETSVPGSITAAPASLPVVPSASADEATRTLQEQLDVLSREATDIPVTFATIHAAPTFVPAAATDVARRYQDNIASMEALQVTREAATRIALPPLPDLAGFAEKPIPVGLSGVVLPSTEDGILKLIYRLPDSLAGVPRSSLSSGLGAPIAHYGEYSPPNNVKTRMQLMVIDVTKYQEFPLGWSAAHSIATMAAGQPEGGERGRDGQVYWIFYDSGATGDQGPVKYTLLMGADSSSWLFQIDARTSEELEALAAAIVTALSPQP